MPQPRSGRALLAAVVIIVTVSMAAGDLGTAKYYNGPPYLPTACYGYSQDQFPSGDLFAAVGDALWDNGAACGRSYKVRCLSGPNRPCIGGFVDVLVVHSFCKKWPCPSTFWLSKKAFALISNNATVKINVEYQQA